MTRLILKEIAEDSKRFGDERRTLMEAVTPISQGEIVVPDEPVTVIISKNGWVRSRQGHGIDPAGIAYKTGDFPWLVTETRTIWPLIVIDGNGRSYSLRVSDLPGGRGDGAPLNTMIDFPDGGKPVLALTAAPESKYLVAGSRGYGFVASIADMVSRNKAGKAFLALDKGEKPLPPALADGHTVAVLTQGGRLLLFPLTELKEMAKGKGLMLIDLAKNDEVVGIAVSDGQSLRIGGSGRGGKPVEQLLDKRLQADFQGNRARRGQEIPFKLKPVSLGLTSKH
jgi:topoisomerase-4 subunit A